MAKAKAKKRTPPSTKAPSGDRSLRIKFDSCGFVSYAINEEPIGGIQAHDAKFTFNREAQIDPEHSVIVVTLEATLHSGEDPETNVYLNAKYRSRFHVAGMEYVKEDEAGNKQFPADFARALIALTFSSMRGALAEKTARTWLEKEILPVFRANVLFPVEDEKINAAGSYPA